MSASRRSSWQCTVEIPHAPFATPARLAISAADPAAANKATLTKETRRLQALTTDEGKRGKPQKFAGNRVFCIPRAVKIRQESAREF